MAGVEAVALAGGTFGRVGKLGASAFAFAFAAAFSAFIAAFFAAALDILTSPS